MGRDCSYVPRDMSHTARFTGVAKLLYPYHPLFHAGDVSLEIIGERSDMLVARLPDGTRRGIPAWMFDEGVCAAVRNSSHPIVHVDSLLEIIDLLELNGLGIRSVHDEHKFQSKESCDVDAATSKTSHTPIRKPRDPATDPGGKKVRVHRLVSRPDRGGRQSSKTSGRRSK
jgi:hypothetical protein